jgi:two-component system, NarL family, invasion response regulator UvrY
MIRVLIADDHALLRRGVREILEEGVPGIFVTEVSSAAETLKTILHDTYDIALLDIAFPDGNGLDVLKEIHSQRPQVHVLFLSMYPEAQYAQRALHLGASGYLAKNSAPDELMNAVQRVMAGGRYITPALAEQLAQEISPDFESPAHNRLSDREFQVLIELGAGKSISEIAADLSLSPKTVSTYRFRLLEKLKLRTTADLIRYVLENQLSK